MISVTQVLDRLHIDSQSRLRAVQDIRTLVENSPSPLSAARSIISNLVPAGVDVDIDDEIEARMTAQHLVDRALCLGDKYDPNQELLKAAQKIAAFHKSDPWFFWTKTYSTIETTTEDRQGVAVQVKADGTLKKGGKQVIAQALYAEHKALDNQSIIKIFMKELDMSKAGATTYLYNCKKAAK